MESSLQLKASRNFVLGGKIELFLDHQGEYLVSAWLPKGPIAPYALKHGISVAGILPTGATTTEGAEGFRQLSILATKGNVDEFPLLFPEKSWNADLSGDRRALAMGAFNHLFTSLAGVSGAIAQDNNQSGPEGRINPTSGFDSRRP